LVGGKAGVRSPPAGDMPKVLRTQAFSSDSANPLNIGILGNTRVSNGKRTSCGSLVLAGFLDMSQRVAPLVVVLGAEPEFFMAAWAEDEIYRRFAAIVEFSIPVFDEPIASVSHHDSAMMTRIRDFTCLQTSPLGRC